MERILVIFDMDGVLVDTLPMLEGVYRRFLEKYGKKGTPEEFAGLNGFTIWELVRYLQEVHGLPGTSEKLLEEYTGLIASGMGQARLTADAEETLKSLREDGCRIGIASSASRQYIETMLETHGVRQYFDFMVTGEDVKRAKPSTEIYEKACKRYEFDRCYIVEDSDNGLKAARLSDERCRTVFFQGTQKYSLEPYDYRIDDLRQLKEILWDPEEMREFFPAAGVRLELEEGGSCPWTRFDREGRKSWDGEIRIPETETAGREEEIVGRKAEAVKREADSLWEREKTKRPQLFNGPLLCFAGLEAGAEKNVILRLFSSEYKYYKWVRSKGFPGRELGLIPAAVSGILLDTEGNALFARRGLVTQYENRWELVPSGSLEIDGQEADSPETGRLEVDSQEANGQETETARKIGGREAEVPRESGSQETEAIREVGDREVKAVREIGSQETEAIREVGDREVKAVREIGSQETKAAREAVLPRDRAGERSRTCVGSRDRVYAQLLEELEQELKGSVPKEAIASMSVLGLSFDIPEQVLDLCVEIRLNLSLRELCLENNEEYEEGTLRLLSPREAVADPGLCGELVPTSLAILKYLTGGLR